MKGVPDCRGVRLAEFVAALSLGIDLGFGQPMEHVLRQCLIALKLADCMGLDADFRTVTYYTSLLVNIGCHTDAHEQAKWFGDDISMKARRYDYDMRSVRGALSAMRDLGAGQPPMHRFRVGLEFAVRGHREVDGMIDHHAKMTRLLAEQLGLAEGVLDGVAAAYERWDGRGWPGSVGGEEIPLPSRIAQLAEFVEVAHRVGGVVSAVALAGERSGKRVDGPAGLTRREVEVNHFEGTAQARIPAPAPLVFDRITDIDQLPAWNGAIERVIERPPALTDGTEWVVVMHRRHVPRWRNRSKLIGPGSGRGCWRARCPHRFTRSLPLSSLLETPGCRRCSRTVRHNAVR